MKVFNRFSFLGLDIGTSLIKAVQLQKKNKDFILHCCGMVETPAGAFKEGKIVDPESLIEQLAIFVKDLSFKGNKAVACLGRENVILRRLSLPPMSRKEVGEAMKFEVEKHINIPLEELIYNYTPLNYSRGKEIDILLAAVSRQVVDMYQEIMERAGLYPAALEVQVLALTRNLPFYFNKKAGYSYPDYFILLDIGEDSTGMVILEKGDYSFHRNLSVGSRTILKGIMDSYGISREEILEKVELGQLSRLKGAEESANPLSEEIQRTLNYYLYKKEIRKIDCKGMLITGGISGIKGIDSWLSSALNIPAQSMNPLNFLKVDNNIPARDNLKRNRFFINTAVGLALGRWEHACN